MKKALTVFLLFSVSAASAQTNYALHLNSASNQFVTIGTPLANNASYTKEAWIYVTSAAGPGNIISSSDAPFLLTGNRLQAGQAGNDARVTDNTDFPTNRWVHVAVTYDASATTMKLYRDGTLVGTNTSVPAYTSEPNFIGAHQGTSDFFQGDIDEVCIWDKALTQAELKQFMYKGPATTASGLVAYYSCNSGSGTLLVNAAGGADGNLQNGTGWISSPVQFSASAIAFDGADDYVSIPGNNTLDIATSITLEAWCYAIKNGGTQNVICKSSRAVNTGYIFPRTDDGWNTVCIYLHIGGWKVLSAPYPSRNAWHHLAATYDGSEIKLYIDGVLAASQSQTGNISINGNNLTLGNQPGYSEYFGGYADEFRVWNTARTQTQIQEDMNKELDPASQVGLVSYYTVNQGVIGGTNTGLTTLIDQENSNNGTLTNFAWSGATSNFVAQSSNIVLPLKWLDFTVQRQGHRAVLNWSTASEENTQDFLIQHSTNKTAWKAIGIVNAAGNSALTKLYTYTHQQPVSGINYYRIRQRDRDGKTSYSEVRPLRFDDAGEYVTVMSNPVANKILKLQISRATPLFLYDNAGKLLWHKDVDAGPADIDMHDYPGGIYLLRSRYRTEKLVLLP